MEYVLATKNDIEQLVDMRIAYLKEDMVDMTEEQIQAVREQLPDYFKHHLGNDILGFIVKNNKDILSTALLLIIHKPANPNFMHGKVGEVLNVYTKPEYRHQGMAKGIMKNLLAYAKDLGLDFVELSATEQGYPLYKSLGFLESSSHYRKMKYIIH